MRAKDKGEGGKKIGSNKYKQIENDVVWTLVLKIVAWVDHH